MATAAETLANMPGTVQDCVVEGITFNKGNFPTGHIFALHDETSELHIVNTTIGGEPFPNVKMLTPIMASYVTFDGNKAYFLDRNANVVAEGELVPVS